LFSKKQFIVYLLAIIMFIFGCFGIIACFGGIFAVKNFNLNIPNFSSLNNSVQEGASSVNVLINDSSVSIENISTTVRETKDTLFTVANLSRSAAQATYGIAESINFQVGTFRPLEGSVKYFTDIGDNLNSLAINVENTAGSIDKNANDIDKIAVDLKDISIKLENTSKSLSTTAMSVPDFGFKKVLYALIAYCGILHLMFVLIGISLMIIGKSGSISNVKQV
jgi:hypothetical protein